MKNPQNDVDALLKARAEIDEQLRRHKNGMTVLFTDIVGSTSFFERNGDTAGLAMIHRHDELTANIVREHDGRIVKTIGDSAMAEFPDAGTAVRAAVEIERQFLKLNSTLPANRKVEVRIGIHSGIGFRKGDDLFGDVVNVAARITKRTGPAQILVSRAVQECVATADLDVKCQWLSTFTLDGRTEKEDIYEVIWTDADTYGELRGRFTTAPSGVPSRYEVLSQLGTGGTGIVYKVKDLETGELVALKMLKPELAADPMVQENLKRELCLARKITHKNVCRIYEFSRSGGEVYTSMELVEGESLLSKLYRSGALPIPEAVEIVRQICSGLREAHAQGIIHRDLKPANIMLDRSGTVKIMDFGIARLIQGKSVNSQMTGTIVGTPAYMAPEQAELKPVSAATDIYATGLVLYEMVTGVPAFAGDTPVAVALKQIRENPKRPREIVATIPTHIESAILKCLQKDPAKRFHSVEELEAALEQNIRTTQTFSWKQSVTPEVKRFQSDIRQFVESTSRDARTFLNKNEFAAKIIKTKPGMAIGAAALLVVAIAGATVHASWKGRSATAAKSAAPAIQVASSTRPVPTPESVENLNQAQLSPITTHEVSLGDDLATSGTKKPSTIEDILDGRDDAELAHPAKSNPRSRQVKSPNKPPVPAITALHAVEPGPALPLITESSSMGGAFTPVPATTAPVVSADTKEHAAKSEAVDATDAKQKPAGVFFEVGTFKDETWAENAVEKLTGLGFQASYVHKSKLWLQTYRVQVGPYANAVESEAGKQKLISEGYKVKPIS